MQYNNIIGIPWHHVDRVIELMKIVKLGLGDGLIVEKKYKFPTRDLLKPANGMIRPIIIAWTSYPDNIPPHPKPVIRGFEMFWDGEWRKIVTNEQ